jgi:hypothetical protein
LLYPGLQFQRQILKDTLKGHVDDFGLLRSSSTRLGGVRCRATDRGMSGLGFSDKSWFRVRLELNSLLAFGHSLRFFAQQIFKKAKHIWFVSG